MSFKSLSFRSFCISVVFVAVTGAAGKASAQVMEPLKNCIKVTMLSLGSGSSRYSFERAFSPKLSAEFTYGAIGHGWDWMNHSNPRGFILKAAPKFMLKERKNAVSWFEGAYFKPELLFANFDYDVTKDHPDKGARKHTRQYALLAEAGYQIVAWGWFLFDIYAGLGPSWGNMNANNYYHGFMLLNGTNHLGLTAGYRIGVAF